jgi:hypothetical protein
MRLLTAILALFLFFTVQSCNQFRCACTDGYVKDVQHSSKKVANQTCESIEEDRQIIKKATKCDLQ